MKKISLLFTAVLLTFTSVNFAQVKFSLTAKNKPSNTLKISGESFNKEITANKKGKFIANLNAPEGMYKLELGEQYTNLYLEPNFDLQVTLDYKDFDNTIVYKGKGALENTYLSKQLLNQDVEIEKIMVSKDATELKTSLNAFINNSLAVLTPDMSITFKEKIKKSLEMNAKQLEDYVMGLLSVKEMDGKMSEGFDYENVKGGKTSLESLKGKYVYIDVWATWCGPCIGEIPSLKKIEQKYHGKNIEFVSISVDEMKNNQKWKNMVAKKELIGIQLFADKSFDSDFAKFYKITSIPRFILIGPEGNIVNADAPRPSSPELVTLLDSLIN